MEHETDLIVIGGGATGAGIALDAALRGLKVKLFEQNDFAEGTSSRSTKLVHGGVRYLEAAIKHIDKEQWKLVREGLKERKIFLRNAPHLAHEIELITPIYKWYEIPYVYAGLKVYDMLSGRSSLGASRILGAKKALERSDAIEPRGLKGAVSYYDGVFNDSRMVIALLQSAEANGAKVYNHHKVESLTKDQEGNIVGVETYDKINSTVTRHYAKTIINATGPFVDTIRKLDDPDCTPLIETSSGIHIVLPKRFLPNDQGVMIPKTSDGRLLFALPYGDHCMIGTTDNPAPLSEHPEATDSEVEFLLEHYNRYFSTKATKDDIVSLFSGLRPLVIPDEQGNTSEVVRESEYIFSPSGMLTVAGGKWTAYRAMAEKAVNIIAKRLEPDVEIKPCATEDHKLIGSRRAKEEVIVELNKLKLWSVSEYLYSHYGDRSVEIADYAKDDGELNPICTEAPLSVAEIRYTVHNEYVKKPLDLIVRRSNIGLIDKKLALSLLDAVSETLAEELGWSQETREEELQEARAILSASI